MGLETATFISGLNANNPVGATDPKSEGDDHLRLIKTTLLNTFPNITGVMNASHTELNNLVGVTGTTGTGNLVLDASPTVTGTLSAAAITTSGVITGDGSGLTALDATALTGEIADARLSANVPLKDADNAFTREGQPQIILRAASHPWIRFEDTDAATDAGHWDIIATVSGLLFRKLDDTNANATSFIDVGVTGNNVDSLALTANSITANGSEVVTTANGVLLTGNQTIAGVKTFSGITTFTNDALFKNVFKLNGVLTPASFNTTQNNYNPAGLSNTNVLKVTPADTIQVMTGLAGGEAGRFLVLMNIGLVNLTLKHESSSSIAANRFNFSNSSDKSLVDRGGAVMLWYDTAINRWRDIGFA